MQRIDILIPTRNRLTKLQRCLSTIPKKVLNIEIQVHILCDGDLQTFNYYKMNSQYICRFFGGHNGSVFCRNAEAAECPDAILYAVDDIEFMPSAIENATKTMREKFPDDDGVVGFTQTGQNQFNPAGVALMGKKFVERYPNKQIFYPGYFLFACQEVHWLANKLNKFYLDDKAILKHYHPNFNKQEMDRTHDDGRIHKKRDHDLIRDRQKKNLIWGEEK
jgi:hypothetical protein